MKQLNYQHLLYFWTVAREGTIARACEILYLTQPTISAQLRLLEKTAGVKLLQRSGRYLVLTDAGQTVFRYADEIFSLGKELQDTLSGRRPGHLRKLVVGIADVLPRTLVHRLLKPVLELEQPVQIICHDDKTETLLTRLAINELDVVLSDVPASPLVKVRAYNHLLGECSVTFLGQDKLVAAHQSGFPESLDGASFIMPMEGSSLRRSLDQWFKSLGINPVIRGEFGDCDLFEVFGSDGVGFFAVPTVIEASIRKNQPLKVLARIDSIKEQFFAITGEKRLRHPAVVAINQAARAHLFQ